MTKSTISNKPAEAGTALQPVAVKRAQATEKRRQVYNRCACICRGQASLEALLVIAAGLSLLALAAAAAALVQQALLQATVASAELAALEKLAGAIGEVAAFAPGSTTRVKLGLLAQNTSFTYANGKLSLRYWHNGKTRKIERDANGRVEIRSSNYSKGNWLATATNRDGTIVVLIANDRLHEEKLPAVKEQPP